MKKTSHIQLSLFGGFWSAVKGVVRRPSRKVPSHCQPDPALEHTVDSLLVRAGARAMAGTLSVQWNSRMRSTAGMACYQRKTIFLNPRLKEVAPREVQRTLRHELAHFLAHHRMGRQRISPHGSEWQLACKDLGIPNEPRCHDLPLRAKRVAPRHFYQCPNCRTVLPRVRPIKRPMACLKCCRSHNGGRYDPRFRFIPVTPPRKLAA